MAHNFGSLVFTPLVKALQEKYGSRRQYARMEAGDPAPDRLRPGEIEFIAERDSFYMATIGESGWPYVQHRGGPEPGDCFVSGPELVGGRGRPSECRVRGSRPRRYQAGCRGFESRLRRTLTRS